MRSLLSAVAFGAALVPLATGCATIVNGRTADVQLQSNPPAALATVRDHEGVVVAQTTTPGQVTLKRGRKWLRPARYTATFEKPGYYPAEAPIGGKFNPWAIGNLAIGGGLGLGVDAVSGALWRPTESTISQSLAMASPNGQPPMAEQGLFAQATDADDTAVRQSSAAMPANTRR